MARNAPKSLTRLKFGAITEFCFWLFPAFPAEKPGGFPSPNPGPVEQDRASLSQQPPERFSPEGLSLALPTVTPGGTTAQPLREAG